MVSSPHMKMGGSFFKTSGGLPFHIDSVEGGLQYQFLAQLANAGPKSSEFNKLSQRSLQNQILPNCHF